MFKFSITLFLILLSSLSDAQTTYFQSIGGGVNNGTTSFAVDSINNKIYLFGVFNEVEQTNLPVRFAAIWDDVKWDSVRYKFGDSLFSIIKIDNELYGLGYNLFKENNLTHNWDVLARANKNQTFNGIAKYNNELVVYGSFDTINGLPIKRIAKYDGVNFIPMGNPNIFGSFSVTEYSGELYVGGSFYDTNYGLDNLAKWNGATWSWLSWASGSSYSSVSKLIVYQNKLFIGGRFSKSTGQVGDNLISWDGTTLIDYNLVGSNVEAVWDMCIYKNKLIITGFKDASIPLSSQQYTGFLSYDGIDLCSYVPHYFNNQSFRLMNVNVFQDSLNFFVNKNNVSNRYCKLHLQICRKY